MKFQLLTPIPDLRTPNGKLSHVEVREVQTVADVLEINKLGSDSFLRSLHLIARLTGLDFDKEVSLLDMRDVSKLLDLINTLSEDPRDPKPEASEPSPKG